MFDPVFAVFLHFSILFTFHCCDLAHRFMFLVSMGSVQSLVLMNFLSVLSLFLCKSDDFRSFDFLLSLSPFVPVVSPARASLTPSVSCLSCVCYSLPVSSVSVLSLGICLCSRCVSCLRPSSSHVLCVHFCFPCFVTSVPAVFLCCFHSPHHLSVYFPVLFPLYLSPVFPNSLSLLVFCFIQFL